MRHFCTLFDSNYLTRGLALHRSLVRHGGDFRLHALCLDAQSHDVLTLLNLKSLELIRIETLESSDDGLMAVKGDRTRAEFCFTSKPSFLQYLLRRHPEIDRITYLDADIYFFSSAAALDKEYKGHPVVLTPHRFSPANARHERAGIFNAGWVSVMANPAGHDFISWWRALCIEWCYARVEPDRFADQKYLDRVPARFPDTACILHAGINAAPWNISHLDVRTSGETVLVAGQALVAYHFHSMRRILFGLYDSGFYAFDATPSSVVRQAIYAPYLRELISCHQEIRQAATTAGLPSMPIMVSGIAGGWAARLKALLRVLVSGTAIAGPFAVER